MELVCLLEHTKLIGAYTSANTEISALYEDACLFVVPGSHLIPRTPEQRERSSTLDPPKNPLDMPGAIQVVLKRAFSLP